MLDLRTHIDHISGQADEMRAETRFHPDDAGRELLERRLKGKALDLLPQDKSAIGAETDEVENLFANVDPDNACSNRILSDLERHSCFSSGAVEP
jgi:hypothetical protein